MKHLILSMFIMIATLSQAQEASRAPNYNAFKAFRCENCTYNYFVSSNSGVLNTPLGYKIGFFGKTGGYLGARFGSGQVLDWETNTKSQANLFSFTAGLIKPLYMKDDVAVHTYLGAGYGQWFNNRRNSWTKGGYEIETGLMFSYKRIMLSVGGAFLDGERTYPKWDGTVGLGVRF